MASAPDLPTDPAPPRLRRASPTPRSEFHNTRYIRLACGVLILLLGAAHAWAYRNTMNVDGIFYLDMGDAFWRGDWGMVNNANWSPMYAVFLGAALKLTNLSPQWEFEIAHAVNFLVFVGALACFEFLLREVLRASAKLRTAAAREGRATVPEWAVCLGGYGLFLWTCFYVIGLAFVTPDILTAAMLFLLTAMLLRIRRGASSLSTFLLFGLCLGVGYYVKSPLFPLAFLFLLLSFFAAGPSLHTLKKVLAAFCVFVVVSAPVVAALSIPRGRLTFGEAGRYMFMAGAGRMWNKGTNITFWQGQPEGSGTPRHPVRVIFHSPDVYEFAGPVGGTCPAFYEPSYWIEGMRVRFNLQGLMQTIADDMIVTLKTLFRGFHAGLAVGAIALLIVNGRGWKRSLADVLQAWPLLVPAVAGVAMYIPVRVEPRYIPAFIALFWLGFYGWATVPDSAADRRRVRAVVGFVLVCLALQIGWASLRPLRPAEPDTAQITPNDRQWTFAEELRHKGIAGGDRLAIVGAGTDAYWARLLHAQIVVQTNPGDFWSASPETRRKALDAMRPFARAVVAEPAAPADAGPGWTRLAGVNASVLRLDAPEKTGP